MRLSKAAALATPFVCALAVLAAAAKSFEKPAQGPPS